MKTFFLSPFQESADAARSEFQFAVIMVAFNKNPRLKYWGDKEKIHYREKTAQTSPEVFYQTGTKNPATVKSRGFCVQKRTYL